MIQAFTSAVPRALCGCGRGGLDAYGCLGVKEVAALFVHRIQGAKEDAQTQATDAQDVKEILPAANLAKQAERVEHKSHRTV